MDSNRKASSWPVAGTAGGHLHGIMRVESYAGLASGASVFLRSDGAELFWRGAAAAPAGRAGRIYKGAFFP